MTDFTTAVHDFAGEVRSRLAALEDLAAGGGFDAAIDLLADAIRSGGVLYAFGATSRCRATPASPTASSRSRRSARTTWC
jgi:hypothetical protein